VRRSRHGIKPPHWPLERADHSHRVASYPHQPDNPIVKELQRALFGRRSEKAAHPDQLELALEDIEQVLAQSEAEAEQADATLKASRIRQRRVNRGALPKHLPREEIVIEPGDRSCPCWGGEMHRIGEDVAERLDIIAAQFRVIVTHRPKYGCRACESAVVQAAAPARLIEGGLPTEAMIAHVLVGKYADHLPLYRQRQVPAGPTAARRPARAPWLLSPVDLLVVRRHGLLDQLQRHHALPQAIEDQLLQGPPAEAAPVCTRVAGG
jgi:transposase